MKQESKLVLTIKIDMRIDEYRYAKQNTMKYHNSSYE